MNVGLEDQGVAQPLLDFLFEGDVIGRIAIGAAFDNHRQRALRGVALEIGHDSHDAVGVRNHLGNNAVDTISLADSDELVVNRQSGVDVSVLPYYLLPKERKQYHHVYLQEVGPDLFYFVAPMQRPNQDIAKQNRVYNLLTFNADGELLNALEQPITHIFLSSFTEDILRINEVSKSSLFEKIAKLYIEN